MPRNSFSFNCVEYLKHWCFCRLWLMVEDNDDSEIFAVWHGLKSKISILKNSLLCYVSESHEIARLLGSVIFWHSSSFFQVIIPDNIVRFIVCADYNHSLMDNPHAWWWRTHQVCRQSWLIKLARVRVVKKFSLRKRNCLLKINAI